MEIKGQKSFGSPPASPAGAKTMSPGVWVLPVFPIEGLERLQNHATASSAEPIWITDFSSDQEYGLPDPVPAHQDQREKD